MVTANNNDCHSDSEEFKMDRCVICNEEMHVWYQGDICKDCVEEQRAWEDATAGEMDAAEEREAHRRWAQDQRSMN